MVKKPGKSSRDERALPRTYLPNWFVEELKAERFPRLVEDELTVRQAADLLGCSLSTVYVLIDDGLLTPFPRKLAKTYRQRHGDKDVTSRGVRGGSVLSRAQVMKVKTDGVWSPRESDLDPTVWQDARQIAEAGAAADWPDRCRLNISLRDIREQDPSVARRVWYTNKDRHWRRKWVYDTAKIGAAPSVAAGHESRAEKKPAMPTGRPPGSIDKQAARRNEKMAEAWQNGEFGSITALARAYHVSRPHASAILDEFGVK